MVDLSPLLPGAAILRTRCDGYHGRQAGGDADASAQDSEDQGVAALDQDDPTAGAHAHRHQQLGLRPIGLDAAHEAALSDLELVDAQGYGRRALGVEWSQLVVPSMNRPVFRVFQGITCASPASRPV
jgi:hypothetical protein